MVDTTVEKLTPPVFDATVEKPTLPDVDPTTIGFVNDGFTVDMTPNGGDFVKMVGNKVYWSKGDKKNIVVLEVKGSIIAYGVEAGGIRVYNSQNKGFFAKYLGIAKDVPYFGKLEEQ